MTRQEADALVAAYGQSMNVQTGLNPNGFGGMSIGMGSLYFEFKEQAQSLTCLALIYKFHDAPKPGIIEGFKAEEAAGTNAGGGKVEYQPENKGLYLSRTYSKVPAQASFEQEMKDLLQASRVWGDEVLDRVTTKVFHSKK